MSEPPDRAVIATFLREQGFDYLGPSIPSSPWPEYNGVIYLVVVRAGDLIGFYRAGKSASGPASEGAA